jgi:hypothetical protein
VVSCASIGGSPLKRQSVYAVCAPQLGKLVKLASELTVRVIAAPYDVARLSYDKAPLVHTSENFYCDGLPSVKGLGSANGNEIEQVPR